MKKILSFLLRISITSGLLIFLFSKTDFKSILKVVFSADPFFYLSAFFLFLFLNFLIVLRWYILLKGLSIDVPFGRVVISYLSSLFINLLVPSTIGGDTARTIDISLHSKKHSSRVLATVVLDRIGGFCGLMAVLAGALLFGYKLLNDASVIIVSLILFFIIIFIFAVAFSTPFFKLVCCLVPFKKLKDYLTQLHEATASYKNDPKALFKVFLVSLIIQGGLSVVYFWIALSVGIKTGLIYYFIFVPVISVISVIPVSIGGLGLRDAASVAFLAKAGITAEGALALSLSNFAFIFAVGFTGGMVYVIDIYRRRIQRH